MKTDQIISAYVIPGLRRSYKFPVTVYNPDKSEIIMQTVLDYSGVTLKEIMAKNRHRNIVVARHLIMFLMRRYTNVTLKEIGKRFKKDHTSVVHACANVKNLMDSDEVFRHSVQVIEGRIQ